MTYRPVELVDDYGRRTTFSGVKLTSEHTDSVDGTKPQYTAVDVWRTEAGQYVVQRTIVYRVRHSNFDCRRAIKDGAVLRTARPDDTFPCETCHPRPDHTPAWGQNSRRDLTVYPTPETLIASFATMKNGIPYYSHFWQTILADLSEQDEAVSAVWMNNVVA